MNLIKGVSHKLYLLVVILPIIFLSILISCSEEPLKIGIHLLPEDELLDVYDTILTVELYTISAKPLKTQSSDYSSLGSINDPVMGMLKTEYIADIFYPSEVSFKDTIIEDNLIIYNLELQLSFDDLYGDSSEIDFEVYELIEKIPVGKESDFIVSSDMINPTVISIGIPEKLNDSIDVFSIMLSNIYAEKFIDPQTVEDGIYDGDSLGRILFKEYFKGLYLKTDFRSSEGGGIIRVNNNSSKMILRTLVWDSDSSRYDTITDLFSVGNPGYIIDSANIVNLGMYQNIPGSNVAAVLDDTINSQSLAYIQSLAAYDILVDFPTLEDFRREFNNNIIINKAELIFSINQELYDADTYSSPGNLGLFDNISKTYLADDGLIPYYFGGYIDINNYQYKFNVGNHIHSYMRGNSDTLTSTRYILFPSKSPNPAVSYIQTLPSRVVLNGGNSAEVPSLKILYSVLEE